MELDYNWINLLILFGAFHGLIFGIVLLLNQKHPGAKFLAVFMLVLSYNGFETFSWSSGLDEYTIVFDLFVFVWIFGLGPSLYLYLQSLLKPAEKITRKHLLIVYSPLLFQFAMNVCVLSLYIYGLQSEKGLGFTDNPAALYAFYDWYSEPVSVTVFLFYLILSIRLFLNSKNQNVISFASKENQKTIYKWVKGLLICMIILGVLWPLSLVVAAVFDISGGVHYYPIEILLVFFIYWIAFVGYHKIKMIHLSDSKNNGKSISKIEAEQYLAALRNAMEQDRLYLDPELNREKLANHLGINAKIISAVLNQYANQNFNDFVNSHRINEVTNKLISGENSHLTISGIALDAGFNSQATFQRVFKAIQGVSPKEFQNLALQKVKN